MSSPGLRLKLGRWSFIPRLKLTILAIIACACLVYLGYWQLQRAHEKKTFLAHLQTRSTFAPVKLHQLKNPSLHTDRFLPVSVDGVFMNQYTFLLDNQVLDRKPGFRVLTPLQSPLLDRWVLIDRGWVPMGANRKELPKIPPAFGLQKIHGQIDTITTGIVWVKDEATLTAVWPVILQELDYQLISDQMQHPVYKFVIRMQPGSKHAFAFPPHVISTDHNKHIAYALQWFAFAFLVLIYYIVMSTKRSKK